MQSSINDDEVIVLKRKVESLNMVFYCSRNDSGKTDLFCIIAAFRYNAPRVKSNH